MPHRDHTPELAISPLGVLLALPAFAAVIVVCAIATSLGWWMTAVILAVLIGLGFVAYVRQSVVLAFGGMLLCVIAGIMGTSIETPMFGDTVRGIRVDQASTYPRAAIFHFLDGRVLTEADAWVPVYGGSKGMNHVLYELRVAPIVGVGWTPSQPVTAWAVTSSPNSDMPRSDWKGPGRAAVRVLEPGHEVRDAIARNAPRLHLVPARNVVLLHWLNDPEAAMASQYARLVTVFCVCAVIWGLIVAGLWLAARRAPR